MEKIGNIRNQTKLTSELKTGQDTIITTSTQLTPMSEVTIQTTAQLKMYVYNVWEGLLCKDMDLVKDSSVFLYEFTMG